MTTQEIVDVLSNGYDAKILTRRDVADRLVNLVNSGDLDPQTARRPYDLIVG